MEAPPARCRDHPRIRGEHLGAERHGLAGIGIIPAYAGSTDAHVGSDATYPDHPRIRGEHHMSVGHLPSTTGSSPHTRGAPPPTGVDEPRPAIIPAYAGSTRAWYTLGGIEADHPRIRGEHRRRHIAVGGQLGSSPHTRGARGDGRGHARPGRIIPAYAGSTRAPPDRHSRRPDHPRIRGEHASFLRLTHSRRGSSPHTRGAPRRRPARLRRPVDHPRIRGEHKSVSISVNTFEGSSPHTRGAPVRVGDQLPQPRIIPAYAGSTPGRRWCGLPLPDHPRIRGEHVVPLVCEATREGSSPHTRGAPAIWKDSINEVMDHPRIRGEHEKITKAADRCAGSSPHTRGAPPGYQAIEGSSWIIPAYAGST